MRTLAVALTVLCLRAQSVLTPDLEALTKIRLRMIFNLQHQPNYTCVETIERFSRPKPTNKLKVVDTLRLEVALVQGRELFAWPGSKKFEEGELSQMVTSGAIGNGNFAVHAEALFTTRSATFHYIGEEQFQGKKALRFDYNVPQMLSGYTIKVSRASAVVGYHGSFYADAATFDMGRIVVIADDIPPELHVSFAQDKIDYAIARIGDGDFLLPAQSELTMRGPEGGEEQNQVKFTSCRQFSGESVVTFGDAPNTKEEAAPTPKREFDLPEGLDLEFVLTKAIDLTTSAVGDPVYARISHDVKKNGEIVIPKNASATGRIVRLERYENYAILGVEFPEIETDGMVARLKGNLTNVVGASPTKRPVSPRSAKQPGEGIIPVGGYQRRLARGCIMFWRT
jgi:hypothetical protein